MSINNYLLIDFHDSIIRYDNKSSLTTLVFIILLIRLGLVKFCRVSRMSRVTVSVRITLIFSFSARVGIGILDVE